MIILIHPPTCFLDRKTKKTYCSGGASASNGWSRCSAFPKPHSVLVSHSPQVSLHMRLRKVRQHRCRCVSICGSMRQQTGGKSVQYFEATIAGGKRANMSAYIIKTKGRRSRPTMRNRMWSDRQGAKLAVIVCTLDATAS